MPVSKDIYSIEATDLCLKSLLDRDQYVTSVKIPHIVLTFILG